MSLEISLEGFGRLVTAVAILLHRLADDGLEVAPEAPVDCGEGRRRLLPDDLRGLEERGAAEVKGGAVGEQFIENRTQRVDIASAVEVGRCAVALLRTHVLHSPQQLPHLRLLRRHRQIGVGRPGHAEVDHLRLAGSIDEDVAGLQIAMDNTLEVAVVNRIADLGKEPKPLLNGEPGIAAVLSDPLRLGDELHRKIGRRLPALTGRLLVVRPGLVDLRDVGMAQAAEDLRLVLESPHR